MVMASERQPPPTSVSNHDGGRQRPGSRGRVRGVRGATGRGHGRATIHHDANMMNSMRNDTGHRISRGADVPRAEQETSDEGEGKRRFTEVRINGPAAVPPAEDGTFDEEDERRNSSKDEEVDEGNMCFICAGLVVHDSVAPCNHRTCHVCALRMRALYKGKDCAHCRAPAPLVIFTDDKTKRYEDFKDEDMTSTDKNVGIRYESAEIMEDTLIILRYNCPDEGCDVACLGWPDLHRHVRSVHRKKLCDLCSRHKKVFTHEQALFTDKDLDTHMRKGDDNPGAINQSGFKGHPLCSFCGTRFYGDDELFLHCREKHERCFICDRHPGQPQYYIDRDQLRMHFRNAHFECPNEECVAQQFIVFETELDLKAHQLELHGKELSKDVMRDARVVDLSSFNLRTPYLEPNGVRGSHRNQREGRGRGRGRDPNVDPVPASSAQPLRRDEEAFQRQLAIQTAQSIAPRTFGGQLTAATPATGTPSSEGPTSMSVPRPSNVVEATTSALDALAVSEEVTPAEQARQLRHRSIIARAGALLQNDASKLDQFRNSISAYKTGSSGMTAAALIDSFFALFSDTSSNSLGTLIRELAGLYDDKKKGDDLRSAWNDWRAINEDYPSLPGPSSITGNGSTSLNWIHAASSSSEQPSAAATKVKAGRVLRLKSSTTQSSHSLDSRNRSCNSASSSGQSQNNPFPGLPPPVSSSSAPRPPTVSTRASAASWATSSSASTARSAAPTSKLTTTRSNLGQGQEAFPALPTSAKPQSTIFGYGSGMVKRGGATPGETNAWGSGGGKGAIGRINEAEEGNDGKVVGTDIKKGKKGKKQLLIGWG